MKNIKQLDIANWLQLSPGFLSQVFNENRSLSWTRAKRIAEIIDARDVTPVRIITASGSDLRKLLMRKYRTAERRKKERKEERYA
jgi:hypothetical protein